MFSPATPQRGPPWRRSGWDRDGVDRGGDELSYCGWASPFAGIGGGENGGIPIKSPGFARSADTTRLHGVRPTLNPY